MYNEMNAKCAAFPRGEEPAAPLACRLTGRRLDALLPAERSHDIAGPGPCLRSLQEPDHAIVLRCIVATAGMANFVIHNVISFRK